jgi:hypothetical protein
MSIKLWSPNEIDSGICTVCNKNISNPWVLKEFEAQIGFGAKDIRCVEHMEKKVLDRYYNACEDKDAVSPVGVLGVQRCGTSLIAYMLAETGVFMGDLRRGMAFLEDDMAYNISVKSMNETCGLDHSLPEKEPNYDAIDNYIKTSDHVKDFVKAKRRSFPWGFKYPNLTYGAKGWAELLPDAKFIICKRKSMKDWINSYTKHSPGREGDMQRVWGYINTAIERVADKKNVLVINLEELRGKPMEEAEKIADFLDTDIRHESINNDRTMRRERIVDKCTGMPGIGGRKDYAYRMHDIANKLVEQNCKILEIGGFRGASASVMALTIRDKGGIVYSVDPVYGRPETWPDGIPDKTNHKGILVPGKKFDHPIYQVFEALRDMGSEGNVVLIPGESEAVFHRWRNRIKFDMLYIDGRHEYEYVKKDLMWVRHLKQKALLVFDDWITPVEQAAKEFFKENQGWKLVNDNEFPRMYTRGY